MTSKPFVRRTLATLRRAELGFFGVLVITCRQTPRRCGQFASAGDLDLSAFGRRPCRTSWLMVGIRRCQRYYSFRSRNGKTRHPWWTRMFSGAAPDKKTRRSGSHSLAVQCRACSWGAHVIDADHSGNSFFEFLALFLTMKPIRDREKPSFSGNYHIQSSSNRSILLPVLRNSIHAQPWQCELM